MSYKFTPPYLLIRCFSGVLLILLLFTSVKVIAQSSVIKGRVRDTALKKDCPQAVVSLLHTDSSLVKFTRSQKDGSFLLQEIDSGSFILTIIHPAYSEYMSTIHVETGINIDLGFISLPPHSELLTAAIVTPTYVLPKMHGDTLEFNTTNLKMRVNASVEEMLRRLPGVLVDQNGVITVNGKKVERLMVDGEDFFAGNPAIVTRNFNADMIAKVQVLDKKSKEGEFTHVDDGQRIKTLNLTLKEDSKRGYFGKAGVGGDPQGYYNFNGLLGDFKGSRQLAGLGMAANTGATGFEGEVESMGAAMNIGGATDAFGASAGTGIPRATGGGFHYANRWTASNDHFNGDYSFGSLSTRPYTSFFSRQVLPDSIYTQQQQSNSFNTSNHHTIGTVYDFNPDSLSSFQFRFSGDYAQGRNDFFSAASSRFNDTLVNSSLRTIHSSGENKRFEGGSFWRIRARRQPGRYFSILLGITQQDQTSKGFLYSRNSFYFPDGHLLRIDTTDEYKIINTHGQLLNSSFAFTNPVGKILSLRVGYGLSLNKSLSEQSTFHKEDGKYDVYIDSISNRYRNDVLTQRGTINIELNGKKLNVSAGGDLLQFTYHQLDVLKNAALNYQYVNFTPRVNGGYSFNDHSGLDFNYFGSSQQPSISQLQPVQNNNDPLHITIGNPNLHGSFNQYFTIEYHHFKITTLNLSLQLATTSTTISTRTTTDSLGRQVTQAVNTEGTYNGGLTAGINGRIKSLDLALGLHTNLMYGRSVNFVNQYLSRNDFYSGNLGFNVSKFIPEKYSIQFDAIANYSYSRSSINLSAPVHYWTQTERIDLSIYPFGFELGTSVFYNWRQKLDASDKKNSVLLWNAYINRDLFKNRLQLRWTMNDILAQNAGINRAISANQTMESITNVIGRYWMLSASWRFMHHRKMD